MIYAKCIRGSQIAKNKDDLEKMKEISNNTVYCEGEESLCFIRLRSFKLYFSMFEIWKLYCNN